MIHSLSLDNFYLTEEQLENSPSRQDGIDKDTEANLRMYGCELIQEAGIMLGFHQVVMATGQVLLHRFYCKRSMKNFNVKKVAATALWVGAKLEEVAVVRDHPRKLQEMVMVSVDRCITRRENTEGRKLSVLDLHSKEGDEFRRSLIRYETEMLRAFGFVMNVEHPHRLLCSCCQILFLPYMKEQDKWDFLTGFVQQAWNIANDSLRTTLCVRFKGSVVACGIIFYTARKLQVPLPDSWWEVFAVKLEDLCEVCRVLHELYLAPKPTFIPVCHQLLPSKPPAPAVAGGVAALRGAVSATPTPMLGATPELNTRPGGKPLDPSVRRTMPGSEFTPAVGAPAAGAAANGASLQSPEGAPAPGSARKRSRSRSPQPSGDESRKRQQLDTQSGKPSGSGREQQLQQQAREAMAAAGASSLAWPGSAAGDRDKDRDRSRDSLRRPDRGPDRGTDRDRGSDRGSRRERPRSRSRDRRRSRSRDNKGRRSTSRDKGRRSRSRERRRSRSRSRDRRRSRSRERRRSRSRSRDRERDRRRDHRDSRDRSVKDRSERDRQGRPRGEQRTPTKPDKQPKQQQQPPAEEAEVVFPLPPKADESSPSQLPAHGGSVQQAAAQDGASSEQQQQQRSSAANGLDSKKQDRQQQEQKQSSPQPAAAAAAKGSSGLPPVQPKPRPKAVRKQHPAHGAADVTSPGKSPQADEGHVPSSAEHSAD